MSDEVRIQVQQMLQEATECTRRCAELLFEASEIMGNRELFACADDGEKGSGGDDKSGDPIVEEPPTVRPGVPADRFDAEASNRTIVVNDGQPVATGRPVPLIDLDAPEDLREAVLAKCGAHANNRTDVDQDIVRRIRVGDMSRYDAVAGLGEGYPMVRKSDGFVRRAYRLPGTERGIPNIPNTISPHFDPSHSVDGVPDWYKRELGHTSFLQELDLTTKFSHDDGATDFEHYVWRVTGVEPMSRKVG